MAELAKAVALAVAVSFAALAGYHMQQWYLSNQVKPGQEWEYCFGFKDNPFETQRCYINKVIDVKDGYVLYHDGFLDMVESHPVSVFKIGSELVQ